MPKLIIAPLSAGGAVTRNVYQEIIKADKLFIQTLKHPVSRWVNAEGLNAASMDDLYETADDFSRLNELIAERIVCGSDAVYAPLGRGCSEQLMNEILKASSKNGTQVVILPSSGFAEAAMADIGMAMPPAAMICSASSIPGRINPSVPICIEELDTRLLAGDIKLTLQEYYPDEFEVYLAYMADNGQYRKMKLKLCDLDRQELFDTATVLYVPSAEFDMLDRYGLEDLQYVLRRLRSPGGCPWDAEQTHETLKTPLIEESYEVLDAIERLDTGALCEELGDLLLQVVFHAQIEEEQREFTMRDVCTEIVKKLIYRHPHVFAGETVMNSEEVLANWETLKRREKAQNTQADAIKAVPKGFPALIRSLKIQKKAADVGFDWDSAEEAFFKIREETDELMQAIKSGVGIKEELGDLLFSAVNVARLLKLDPELCLNESADKFADRFMRMESLILGSGKRFSDMNLSEMDEFWEKTKA